jgi:hypothetical protein
LRGSPQLNLDLRINGAATEQVEKARDLALSTTYTSGLDFCPDQAFWLIREFKCPAMSADEAPPASRRQRWKREPGHGLERPS